MENSERKYQSQPRVTSELYPLPPLWIDRGVPGCLPVIDCAIFEVSKWERAKTKIWWWVKVVSVLAARAKMHWLVHS